MDSDALFTFDDRGALLMARTPTPAEAIRELRRHLALFTRRVRSLHRTETGDFTMHDPRLGRLGSAWVLWENVTLLAATVNTSTLPDLSPQQAGAFSEAGVIHHVVEPRRNFRPIAEIAMSVLFRFLKTADGWPDIISAADLDTVENLDNELGAWAEHLDPVVTPAEAVVEAVGPVGLSQTAGEGLRFLDEQSVARANQDPSRGLLYYLRVLGSVFLDAARTLDDIRRERGPEHLMAFNPGDDDRIDALVAKVPDVREWSSKAVDAIRKGGADPLDESMNPGLLPSKRQGVLLAEAIDHAKSDFPDRTLLRSGIPIGERPSLLYAYATKLNDTYNELRIALQSRRTSVSTPTEAVGATGPKKRRARRTPADRVRDEGKIAAYLIEHPDATRDKIVKATGIGAAQVSESKAWKTRKAARREAGRANRPTGSLGE